MPLEGQDVMTGEVFYSIAQKNTVSDSESEDGDDECGGVGGIAAPYPQFSLQFGSLECDTI